MSRLGRIIRGGMDHQPYWFGVTYTFTCPACRKLSSEKAGLNSPTGDLGKLRQRPDRQELKCQNCQTPLPNGVDVVVDLKPGTLQSLKAKGFPFPFDK